MRKKPKYLLFTLITIAIVLLVAGFVLPFFFEFSGGQIVTSVSGVALGIVTPYYIGHVIETFGSGSWYSQIKRIIRKNIISKDEEFRISYGYLFRIYHEGKYLLITDNHGISNYKVPGGTYKLDAKSKEELKEKYSPKTDDMYDNSIKKDDYRLIVKAKYLKDIYKYFNKSHKEGHVDKEIINGLKAALKDNSDIKVDARSFDVKFRRRDIVIKYPKHFKYFEMIIADIYEVEPSSNFSEYLEELKVHDDSNPKYRFATETQIIRRGVDMLIGQATPTISDHSYKILPNLPERESFIEY